MVRNLYMGSQKLCPIRVNDYTLMGNQLRRAYAYTNLSNVTGQFNLFAPNYTAILEQPFEITGPCYAGTYKVIINGVLYSVSSSNNKLILTQVTTSGTWKKFGGAFPTTYLVSSDNTIWSLSGSNARAINMNGITLSDPDILDNYILDNGILYKVSNGALTLFDNSGIWSYVGNRGGIRNNKIVKITLSTDKASFSEVVDCFDVEFNPLLLAYSDSSGGSYIGYYGNKFYYADPYYGNYVVKDNNTGLNPVAMFFSTWNGCMMLCDDNKLYDIAEYSSASSNLRVTEQFSDIQYWVKAGNGTALFINDNQIYCYIHVNQSNPIDNVYKDMTFYSEYSGCTAEMGSTNGNIFFAQYNTGSILKTTKYKSKYSSNKAYESLTNSIPNQDITSSSESSITIGGKVYNRDTKSDGVFTFVPSELQTHNFTDQDLCQAYLNAGVIEQD